MNAVEDNIVRRSAEGLISYSPRTITGGIGATIRQSDNLLSNLRNKLETSKADIYLKQNSSSLDINEDFSIA